MSIERSTIILPCAGSGHRLGWPVAKELIPIGKRRVLLDATLDLISPSAEQVRVVIVVNDHREATLRHMRRRCAELGVPWAAVYQPDDVAESTGAPDLTP